MIRKLLSGMLSWLGTFSGVREFRISMLSDCVLRLASLKPTKDLKGNFTNRSEFNPEPLFGYSFESYI